MALTIPAVGDRVGGPEFTVPDGREFGVHDGVLGAVIEEVEIPTVALFKATIGNTKWVQPRPIVRPLNKVKNLKASIPTGLLGKQSLGMAISDRVIAISQDRSDRQFQRVLFEQAHDRSLWPAGVDGLVTVRVRSVNFVADDSDDPRARLFVHVWTNFDMRSTETFVYKGERRRVSEWRADDARLFRKEITSAVQSLAVDIADAMFPTSSASTAVAGRS